jgi:hypothetical protein
MVFGCCFGGGYLDRKSFIEFSKRLIDSLNAWQSEGFRLNMSEFTKSAYSMNFYESMLVIEKKNIDKHVVDSYFFVVLQIIGKITC